MLSWNKWFDDPLLIAFISDGQIDFMPQGASFILTQAQKAFLSQHAGATIDCVASVKQVHEATIWDVDQTFIQGTTILEGDGLITRSPNIPLAIRTADCLPVFIFDPRQRAIGLVHAGWRGSRKRIVEKTVKRMAQQWKTSLEDLKVVLGPAIRSCCYEVGREFLEYFPQEVIVKDQHLFLDLPLVNKTQLSSLGVREENIFDCRICTCCDQQFFSHRRDGAKAGRMLSVMMLKTF